MFFGFITVRLYPDYRINVHHYILFIRNFLILTGATD
jgi:hypothetical protein